MTLARSRSWGISTTESMPARAAWAATELARLPVEAQAATLNPSWRALVRATDTTRSLNEPVGLAVSSLIHSSPRPELGGQAVGPDQRGEAGAQVDRGGVGHRQQVGVAPDRPGPGGDPLPGDGGGDPLVVVGRPRAARSRSRTRAAPRPDRCGHIHDSASPKRNPQQSPHRSGIGTWHAVDPSWVVGRALVAAASQGPVPQLLWMMASIVADPTGRPSMRAGCRRPSPYAPAMVGPRRRAGPGER